MTPGSDIIGLGSFFPFEPARQLPIENLTSWGMGLGEWVKPSTLDVIDRNPGA